MNWVSIDFGNSYSSATIMVEDKPVKVHPIGGLYNTLDLQRQTETEIEMVNLQ